MKLLELEAIAWRRKDREVLRSVTFSVAEAELVAIDGGARSGKSTMLKLIVGALAPSSGSIRFDGEDPRPRLGREGGLQLARTTFHRAMGGTVLEQVASPRTAFVSPRRAREEAWQALLLTGAERLVEERPIDLHPDDRVRVGIAQAVMCRPRLLLVDEPLRGVDPDVRDELIALLKKLRAERGMAVLITTATSKGLGGWRHESLDAGLIRERPRPHDAGDGGEVVPFRRGTGS